MLNATRVEIFRKTIFLALGSMTITAVYDKLVVAGGLLSVRVGANKSKCRDSASIRDKITLPFNFKATTDLAATTSYPLSRIDERSALSGQQHDRKQMISTTKGTSVCGIVTSSSDYPYLTLDSRVRAETCRRDQGGCGIASADVNLWKAHKESAGDPVDR